MSIVCEFSPTTVWYDPGEDGERPLLIFSIVNLTRGVVEFRKIVGEIGECLLNKSFQIKNAGTLYIVQGVVYVKVLETESDAETSVSRGSRR